MLNHCALNLFLTRTALNLGRKGIEPLIAYAIEFTAQPVIPTNGTFLYIYY
jgi:hypothetical protein